MKQPLPRIRALATMLLPISLLAFGICMGLYQFLATPTPIKNALHESGVYNIAANEIVRAAQQHSTQSAAGQIPLDNPDVQKVISQAIPPDILKQQTESAIDNTYTWLHGKSSKLNFSINLQDIRTRLADGMASYTEQYISRLPVCRSGEMPDLENPLNTTCVPPNFDASIASAKVRNNILNNEFLKDSSITADDLNSNGMQPVEQQFSQAPTIYKQVQWGTYITGILSVLLAAAVLFMNGTLNAGLKRLAITILTVGALSAAIAWLAGVILHKIGSHIATNDSSEQLQASILRALEILTRDVRNWWIIYGLILIVLGIAALITWRIVKSRASTPTPLDTTNDTNTNDTPVSDSATQPDSDKNTPPDNTTTRPSGNLPTNTNPDTKDRNK